MHEKVRFGRCKLMFSFSGQNIQNVWQTGDFTARFACKGKSFNFHILIKLNYQCINT